MQRIFSSPNLIEVTQLKNMLEEEGIACFIRNEMTSGLVGEIPASEGTPELWIQEDKDMTQALQIKKDWQAPSKVEGEQWVCLACGETSEPQFDSCWKCGSSKS